MNARSAGRWVALASFGLLALASVLIWLRGPGPLPGDIYDRSAQLTTVISAAVAIALGGLIVSRYPENLYGWVWLGMGVASTMLCLGEAGAVLIITGYWDLPLVHPFALAADIGWLAAIACLPLALVLFPNGRPPSPRWAWLPRMVIVSALATVPFAAVISQDYGTIPLERPLALVGVAGTVAMVITGATTIVVLAALIPAALSLIFRFRASSGIERLQIKWLAFAGVAAVAGGIVGQFDAPGLVDAAAETTVIVAPALGIAIAILRYRLYDIDRLINRALVYGGLTAVLVAAYLAVVVSLQALLPTGNRDFEVAASTLLVAGLFTPVRRRLQAFIDKRFYRQRYDGRRAIESFAFRLRSEVDLSEVSTDLMQVVGQTVQPIHAGLWLREGAAS